MDILYEDSIWRVTPTTLERGATTYPIRTIASVSAPLQDAFELFGGFLLNSALFLFGLWCITQFSTGWVIGGLIAAAIGGFNVWGQFHRGYFVIIKFSSGEDVHVQMQSQENINTFYQALRHALDS